VITRIATNEKHAMTSDRDKLGGAGEDEQAHRAAREGENRAAREESKYTSPNRPPTP